MSIQYDIARIYKVCSKLSKHFELSIVNTLEHLENTGITPDLKVSFKKENSDYTTLIEWDFISKTVKVIRYTENIIDEKLCRVGITITKSLESRDMTNVFEMVYSNIYGYSDDNLEEVVCDTMFKVPKFPHGELMEMSKYLKAFKNAKDLESAKEVLEKLYHVARTCKGNVNIVDNISVGKDIINCEVGDQVVFSS